MRPILFTILLFSCADREESFSELSSSGVTQQDINEAFQAYREEQNQRSQNVTEPEPIEQPEVEEEDESVVEEEPEPEVEEWVEEEPEEDTLPVIVYTPSFEPEDVSLVVNKKCSTCHSLYKNKASFDAEANQILASIRDDRMPKGQPNWKTDFPDDWALIEEYLENVIAEQEAQ